MRSRWSRVPVVVRATTGRALGGASQASMDLCAIKSAQEERQHHAPTTVRATRPVGCVPVIMGTRVVLVRIFAHQGIARILHATTTASAPTLVPAAAMPTQLPGTGRGRRATTVPRLTPVRRVMFCATLAEVVCLERRVCAVQGLSVQAATSSVPREATTTLFVAATVCALPATAPPQFAHVRQTILVLHAIPTARCQIVRPR